MQNPQKTSFLLPKIVLAQLAGTSLWFAGNAVTSNLIKEYEYPSSLLGYMTSSVQLGFIAGTLVFAFLSIADRMHPSRLFMLCSILGAVFNIGLIYVADSMVAIIVLRALTGFFLAGVYPVGMKISADWYEKGLGTALGYLVGALVLGTAFPHLLKLIPWDLGWKSVFITTSVLAGIGGLTVGFGIPEGPFRKKSTNFELKGLFKAFSVPEFRAAAVGYFGHMWELYAFWTFVPVLLSFWMDGDSLALVSFLIIALGALGCVAGGYISMRTGSAKVAFLALLISGICCISSPLLIQLPMVLALGIISVWGIFVVADSPQFSTLIARYAPVEYRGSALTMVNCIGFALTIPSIELLNWSNLKGNTEWMYLILVPGPVLGLIAMYISPLFKSHHHRS